MLRILLGVTTIFWLLSSAISNISLQTWHINLHGQNVRFNIDKETICVITLNQRRLFSISIVSILFIYHVSISGKWETVSWTVEHSRTLTQVPSLYILVLNTKHLKFKASQYFWYYKAMYYLSRLNSYIITNTTCLYNFYLKLFDIFYL